MPIDVMAGWIYDFRCRDCLLLEHREDGDYCTELADHRDPIHADDDYHVRCDRYEPRQMNLEVPDLEEEHAMVKSRTFIATPPGATIREQLADRGMSQKEFASRMAMSEKHISRLINGDVQLTPEMAARLEDG